MFDYTSNWFDNKFPFHTTPRFYSFYLEEFREAATNKFFPVL